MIFIELDHSRWTAEHVSVGAAKRRVKNHEDRSSFSQNWWAAEVKKVMC